MMRSTMLPEMKDNILYELIRAVISGWTSVNYVSHNAGSLSTQFITFLGVKSSFFIAFFHLIMSGTNNKYVTKIQLQQVRWLARNGFFSTFRLSSTRTNLLRTCCINLDMSRLMQQVRDQVFDKKN